MAGQQHRIGRQILEVILPQEPGTRVAQEAFRDAYYEYILPLLERLFDELVPPDQLIQLDFLELDLGQIGRGFSEKEILPVLEQKLRQQLTAAIEAHSKGSAMEAWIVDGAGEAEIMLFFLLTGRPPHWIDPSKFAPAQRLQRLLETNSKGFVIELLNELQRPIVVRRVAWTFSEELRQQLLQHLLPAHAATIGQVQKDLITLHRAEQLLPMQPEYFALHTWEAIFGLAPAFASGSTAAKEIFYRIMGRLLPGLLFGATDAAYLLARAYVQTGGSGISLPIAQEILKLTAKHRGAILEVAPQFADVLQSFLDRPLRDGDGLPKEEAVASEDSHRPSPLESEEKGKAIAEQLSTSRDNLDVPKDSPEEEVGKEASISQPLDPSEKSAAVVDQLSTLKDLETVAPIEPLAKESTELVHLGSESEKSGLEGESSLPLDFEGAKKEAQREETESLTPPTTDPQLLEEAPTSKLPVSDGLDSESNQERSVQEPLSPETPKSQPSLAEESELKTPTSQPLSPTPEMRKGEAPSVVDPPSLENPIIPPAEGFQLETPQAHPQSLSPAGEKEGTPSEATVIPPAVDVETPLVHPHPPATDAETPRAHPQALLSEVEKGGTPSALDAPSNIEQISPVTEVGTSPEVEDTAPESIKDRFKRFREMWEQQPEALIPTSKTEPLKIPWRQDEKGGFEVMFAGLILLWPYLAPLFRSLDWMDKKDFVTEEARYSGVCLLHYIATGNPQEPEEPSLAICKVLAGMDPSDPVPVHIHITDAQREEADGMLKAAISNWSGLKKTSPAGLRQSFLQRRGILRLDDQGWMLHVERQTLDVLIDRIPWGISTIRLAWQKKMIFVEW